ncbi:hypothetical protein ACRRTK_021851 [Alexandromys fortis]
MESKVRQEWQEFLVCLGPQVPQALLVSVSQLLAPCNLVNVPLAKGLTSESPRVRGSLHKPRLGEEQGEKNTQSWGSD